MAKTARGRIVSLSSNTRRTLGPPMRGEEELTLGFGRGGDRLLFQLTEWEQNSNLRNSLEGKMFWYLVQRKRQLRTLQMLAMIRVLVTFLKGGRKRNGSKPSK